MLMRGGSKTEDFREELAPTSLSRPLRLCSPLPLENPLCHQGTSLCGCSESWYKNDLGLDSCGALLKHVHRAGDGTGRREKQGPSPPHGGTDLSGRLSWP